MKTGGGWAGLGAAGGTENQEEQRLPGTWDREEEGGQLPARPQALQAGQPCCPCCAPRHPARVGPGGCCGGHGGLGTKEVPGLYCGLGGLSTPGPPAVAAWPPMGCI